MAGTMDGETFVQASDFTNHLNQAEYEISWNRTEADEEGNTVYTVTLSAKIPWNGIQTDAEAYIEYEDISLVDATTGMVLPAACSCNRQFHGYDGRSGLCRHNHIRWQPQKIQRQHLVTGW